jgi:hypothetical protein
MAKQRVRRQREVSAPTPFEQARDEMFQHIMQCGVIGADPTHQAEWFNETMAYVSDRYHELTPEQVAELRTLGERFCQPPKAATHEERASTVTAA